MRPSAESGFPPDGPGWGGDNTTSHADRGRGAPNPGAGIDRTVAEKLHRILTTIDRPGSFCVTGGGPAPLPGLEVAGLGPIGLPLSAGQATELKKRCRQAPYGKGEQTVVDASVRRVWQVEPAQFALTNPDWPAFVAATVATVQRELGLDGQELHSHLYTLLLYEPGSFFLPHRDGEKLDRMVATLVVVLPSAFEGGELVVRHDGEERVVDFAGPARNPFHTHFAAFYADCEHEVRPLRTGHRLGLVYNLTLAKSKPVVAAPRTADRVGQVAAALRAWSPTDPRKLAVPLDHQYTQDGLTWDALKGVDRVKARVFAEAAGRAGCVASIALLTLEESGEAEESSAPRARRRRSRGDEESHDPDDYEMGEVFDSTLTAEAWSDPDGKRLAFGRMHVEEEEIVPQEAMATGKPQQDVDGYTGNEGLTLTRWYRHAAVFLWPAAHHFEVLCDSGLADATVGLRDLTERWTTAGRADKAKLKAQATAFADAVLGRWRGLAVAQGPAAAATLMASLAHLDDARLTGRFLAEIVARDAAVEPDDATVAACDRHGWAAYTPTLAAIFGAPTAESLGRNVRLFERLCSIDSRPTGDRLALCQRFGVEVVSAVETIDGQDHSKNWSYKPPNRPELLARLARSLVVTDQLDLLARAVTHALAAPQLYPLPDHVAALTSLQSWLKAHLKSASPAVSSWLAACCTQLEALTVADSVAPTDYRRDANLSCTCADCADLRAFLQDPREKSHRFRVRQDRRLHLENALRGGRIDATCVTDRTGSPQSLVFTKTTASYEASVSKLRADRDALATLRSIQTGLPK